MADSLPILILRTGDVFEELRVRRGNFDDWFQRELGPERGPFVVVDAVREDLPDPARYAAVLVTGSPASVHDREPWSEAAAAWLVQAAALDRPIFGICYGHQLLAHAFGGRVERNPKGPEIGRVEVDVTDDDPLLAPFVGEDGRLSTWQVHNDVVTALPDGARSLARSDRTAHQAFALGDRIRGVQWHPEFDADIVRACIERDRDELDLQTPGSADALRDRAVDFPNAGGLLRRFVDVFASPAAL